MTTKLSISFTDAHAKLITEAVKSGQYASASEVVREALRLRERAIDAAIEEGIASGFDDEDRAIADVVAKAQRGWKTGAGREAKVVKARKR